MDIKVYSSDSIPGHVYQDVSVLLHDAFEERRLQGINFKCGTFSPIEIKEYLQTGGVNYLIQVFDEGELVGTLTLIVRKKANYKYASHDNLAVLSSAKGKGVASLLFQQAVQLAHKLDLDFLSSSTAVNAVSSVKYHKKVGFIIYSKSYGLSYNSYNFIYPIKKLRFLKNSILRWIIYIGATALGVIRKHL